MIIGREAERQRIESLVTDAVEGRGGVLVLRGEAGIGKSALLEFGAGVSTETEVLRSTGVQSEYELPFAALHQLVGPCMSLVDASARTSGGGASRRVRLDLRSGR